MEEAVKMVNSVEEIDVAKVMAVESAKEAAKKLEAAMEADPEINGLMEAAETVEDMFVVAKKFITITLEQFKVVCQKTLDFFKQDKAIVGDEMLDSVSGGGWSEFWNKVKKPLAAIGIIVACTAVGIAAGAALGGFLGAPIGGVAGFAGGIIWGVNVACNMK